MDKKIFELAPGDIINNKYSIIGKLSAGGMGTIYKAKNIFIENYVVIKVINIYSNSYSDCILAINNEKRVLSQLKHDNIVKLYDYFEIEDTPIIIYEYVEGVPVNILLKAIQKFQIKQYLNIAVQILETLSFIHNNNFIYLDISPSNVIVNFSHQKIKIKLIDFGLTTEIGRAIIEKKFIGKVKYASPELLFSEKLSFASDIFSLGLMFYEMITGNHLFENLSQENIISLLSKENDLPMNEKEIGDPNLVKILKKMIKINIRERYKNCTEVLADLNPILSRYSLSDENNLKTIFDRKPTKSVIYHKPKRK